MTRLVPAWFLLAISAHTLSAQAPETCADVPARPGVFDPIPADVYHLHELVHTELKRWIPHLTVFRMAYMEGGGIVPDARADSLERELDEWATRSPIEFRDMMLAAIGGGATGFVPEMVSNQAAAWYRTKDGRAGPVLRVMRDAPSDTWLLALSAIKEALLTKEEEDVVVRVACDVALPLIAALKAGGYVRTSNIYRGLKWVGNADGIVRHAERLATRRRGVVTSLVESLKPGPARVAPAVVERSIPVPSDDACIERKGVNLVSEYNEKGDSTYVLSRVLEVGGEAARMFNASDSYMLYAHAAHKGRATEAIVEPRITFVGNRTDPRREHQPMYNIFPDDAPAVVDVDDSVHFVWRPRTGSVSNVNDRVFGTRGIEDLVFDVPSPEFAQIVSARKVRFLIGGIRTILEGKTLESFAAVWRWARCPALRSAPIPATDPRGRARGTLFPLP